MAGRSLGEKWILCWIVALLGALASALAGHLLREAEDRQLRAHFERQASEYALAVEHELNDGLTAVESAAALFEAAPHVTREEFRRATAHLLERHASLRAVGWNLRIPESERVANEDAARRSGLEGYRITERAPTGELVAAGSRPEYVAVQYIEPREGNEAAIGYDVGSERRRRAALERAAATGGLGLTSQISLVQEGNDPGFLAFWPVHRHEASGDLEAAEDRVTSFVVGVFHVAKVIEPVTRATHHSDIAIRIEDVTDPEAIDLLYANRLGGREGAGAEPLSSFAHTATLEQGGRTWRLQFVPGPELVAFHRSFVPILALLVGLAITALATAYLLRVLRFNADLQREMVRRRQAERERRHLDAKLREAQKLESLGVLAGGIAHDFNNLLTGILGNTELALEQVSPDAPVREELEQVHLSARRAAELTGQMLAYTGTRPFTPEVFDLSALVREMSSLLRASVSKSAQIVCDFPSGPLRIEGDPTQIRQIVMNLITNASDALADDSGVISVHTGARRFDDESLASAYLNRTPGPGSYVFVRVSDDGCGMTPNKRARVFDPFFSTKFTGRGLGLAAVLGIVRSHRGAIWVESEPGKGSTFTVAFPATKRLGGEDVRPERSKPELRGRGKLLVVDDEESVRRIARRVLTRFGFDVITAASGEEALASFRDRPDEIRTVLLDATMPGMSGADTFRAMRRLRPEARILITSGYSGDELPRDDAGEPPDGFLAKPYTQTELAEILERVLPG